MWAWYSPLQFGTRAKLMGCRRLSCRLCHTHPHTSDFLGPVSPSHMFSSLSTQAKESYGERALDENFQGRSLPWIVKHNKTKAITTDKVLVASLGCQFVQFQSSDKYVFANGSPTSVISSQLMYIHLARGACTKASQPDAKATVLLGYCVLLRCCNGRKPILQRTTVPGARLSEFNTNRVDAGLDQWLTPCKTTELID